MEYHIVSKVELVDGELVRIAIGYTESHEDAIALEGFCEWDAWARDNVVGLTDGTTLLSEHFDINPICYEAVTITNNIDGLNLTLLTTLL
jgi:hypothetical protein